MEHMFDDAGHLVCNVCHAQTQVRFE
jgi:hypothetical protein